jgi:hypothetical protein
MLVESVAVAGFCGYLFCELAWLWLRPARPMSVRQVCAISIRLFLVLLLLVHTEMHSWYFSWPLVLATLLGWRSGLCRLVVGLSVTSLPVDYLVMSEATADLPTLVRLGLGLIYLGLPFLAVLPALRGRLGQAVRAWRDRGALRDGDGRAWAQGA